MWPRRVANWSIFQNSFSLVSLYCSRLWVDWKTAAGKSLEIFSRKVQKCFSWIKFKLLGERFTKKWECKYLSDEIEKWEPEKAFPLYKNMKTWPGERRWDEVSFSTCRFFILSCSIPIDKFPVMSQWTWRAKDYLGHENRISSSLSSGTYRRNI